MKAEKKLIIQGDIGSNHHLAGQKIFPGILDDEIICGKTFQEVCDQVEQDTVPFGLMAIENTVAGTIHANFDLLSSHHLSVVQEVILPIHHCLLGLPNAELGNITCVYSHEMALRQCERFLQLHTIEPREHFDTAGSARFIKEQGDPTQASIAPKSVAVLEGLKILAENIESVPNTQTRFLLLTHTEPTVPKQPLELKVMTECTLPHVPGSLSLLLEVLKKNDCNLTKIELLPIIDAPWEYRFYIDFTVDNVSGKVESILLAMQGRADALRIHGIFPREEDIV